MLSRNVVHAVWYCLLAAALAVSTVPAEYFPSAAIAAWVSNHWFHFVFYAVLVAIPVTIWKKKYRFMLSLVAIFVVIAAGALQAFRPGRWNSSQNALPDLFGVAAGVLLGLNLRMIRHPQGLPAQSKPPRRSSRRAR